MTKQPRPVINNVFTDLWLHDGPEAPGPLDVLIALELLDIDLLVNDGYSLYFASTVRRDLTEMAVLDADGECLPCFRQLPDPPVWLGQALRDQHAVLMSLTPTYLPMDGLPWGTLL